MGFFILCELSLFIGLLVVRCAFKYYEVFGYCHMNKEQNPQSICNVLLENKFHECHSRNNIDRKDFEFDAVICCWTSSHMSIFDRIEWFCDWILRYQLWFHGKWTNTKWTKRAFAQQANKDVKHTFLCTDASQTDDWRYLTVIRTHLTNVAFCFSPMSYIFWVS